MSYYEADFFSKYSKFNAESKNLIKNEENVSSFPDKCIWTGSGKLSIITRIFVVGSQRVTGRVFHKATIRGIL